MSQDMRHARGDDDCVFEGLPPRGVGGELGITFFTLKSGFLGAAGCAWVNKKIFPEVRARLLHAGGFGGITRVDRGYY